MKPIVPCLVELNFTSHSIELHVIMVRVCSIPHFSPLGCAWGANNSHWILASGSKIKREVLHSCLAEGFWVTIRISWLSVGDNSWLTVFDHKNLSRVDSINQYLDGRLPEPEIPELSYCKCKLFIRNGTWPAFQWSGITKLSFIIYLSIIAGPIIYLRIIAGAVD